LGQALHKTFLLIVNAAQRVSSHGVRCSTSGLCTLHNHMESLSCLGTTLSKACVNLRMQVWSVLKASNVRPAHEEAAAMLVAREAGTGAFGGAANAPAGAPERGGPAAAAHAAGAASTDSDSDVVFMSASLPGNPPRLAADAVARVTARPAAQPVAKAEDGRPAVKVEGEKGAGTASLRITTLPTPASLGRRAREATQLPGMGAGGEPPDERAVAATMAEIKDEEAAAAEKKWATALAAARAREARLAGLNVLQGGYELTVLACFWGACTFLCNCICVRIHEQLSNRRTGQAVFPRQQGQDARDLVSDGLPCDGSPHAPERAQDAAEAAVEQARVALAAAAAEPPAAPASAPVRPRLRKGAPTPCAGSRAPTPPTSSPAPGGRKRARCTLGDTSMDEADASGGESGGCGADGVGGGSSDEGVQCRACGSGRAKARHPGVISGSGACVECASHVAILCGPSCWKASARTLS